MKPSELKNESPAELQNLLGEKTIKLGELRFRLVNKQLKNVKEIREVRKDIARIKTLLKQHGE